MASGTADDEDGLRGHPTVCLADCAIIREHVFNTYEHPLRFLFVSGSAADCYR